MPGARAFPRPAGEHETLRQAIDAALSEDETRLEVQMVRQTMADVERDRYRAEERLADRKRTLLEQLRQRWAVPAETARVIESTDDPDRLAEWLRNFATAQNLDAVGIRPDN